MNMKDLLQKVLKDVGLKRSILDNAFKDAIKLLGDIKTEQSRRIKINCALSYRKNGQLCDLGSYVNIYPIVLALLGMRVTVVDYYPQLSKESPDYNSNTHKVIDVYRSVGINVIKENLYDASLPKNSFNIITSFETFEHLWHSPKPIMEKVVTALHKKGEFVLSVPNIVNLGTRLKVLAGCSPLSSFDDYFEKGYPFTGHRREMTISEVHHMMTKMGLKKVKLFTSNIKPPLGEKARFMGRFYRMITDNLPLPPGMRETICAVYKKEG